MDFVGGADPYCTVVLEGERGGGAQRRTRTAKGLAPEWGQSFRFQLDPSRGSWVFHFDLFDEDVGKDEWMGRGELTLSPADLRQCVDRAVEWTDLPLGVRPDCADDQRFLQKHGGSLGALTVAVRCDPPLAGARPEVGPSEEEYAELPATLDISVDSARDLIICDPFPFNSSDPYVVVEALPEDSRGPVRVGQTHHINGNHKNPSWSSSPETAVFRLDVGRLGGCERGLLLRFTVWDYDKGSSSDFMGCCEHRMDPAALRHSTRSTAQHELELRPRAGNPEDAKLWEKERHFGFLSFSVRGALRQAQGSVGEQLQRAAGADRRPRAGREVVLARGELGPSDPRWPGFAVERFGGCSVVSSVEEGSPAAAAGLAKGALVLSAGGMRAPSCEDVLKRLRREESFALVLGEAPDGDGEVAVRLLLEVVKARGLPRADTFGSSDPFVLVQAADAGGQPVAKRGLPLRSEPRRNTTAPEWGWALPPLLLGKGQRVWLDVYDHDDVGAHDFLGRAEIDAAALPFRPDYERKELPLRARGEAGDDVANRCAELGELSVRLKAEALATGTPPPTPEGGGRLRRVSEREALVITPLGATGLKGRARYYCAATLVAPSALPGEGATLPVDKSEVRDGSVEWLPRHRPQLKLEFGDCGEGAVQELLLRVMEKGLLRDAEYGRAAAAPGSGPLWGPADEGECALPLLPPGAKEARIMREQGADLGMLRVRYAFARGAAKWVAEPDADTAAGGAEPAGRRPVLERLGSTAGLQLLASVPSAEGLPDSERVRARVICGQRQFLTDWSEEATRCPDWPAAHFAFPVECRTDGLRVVVEKRKTLGAPAELCEGRLAPCQECDFAGEAWVPLLDAEERPAGKALVRWRYRTRGQAPLERPAQQAALPRFEAGGWHGAGATVRALQLSGLQRADGGSITPVLELRYGGAAQRLAELKQDTRCAALPEGASHTFPLSEGEGASVRLELYDRATFGSNKLVACAELDLVGGPTAPGAAAAGAAAVRCPKGTVLDLSEEVPPALQAAPLSDEPAASVGRRITHIDGAPVDGRERVLSAVRDGSVLLCLSGDEWLELRAPEDGGAGRPLGCMRVKWWHSLQLQQRKADPQGSGPPKLSVTVHEGRGLLRMDTFSSDPFVSVAFGGSVCVTETVKGSRAPKWTHDPFVFPAPDAKQKLELTCWDWDRGDSNDFMGCATLDPFAVVLSGASESASMWLPLRPRAHTREDEELWEKEGGDFGEIRVTLALSGDLARVANLGRELPRQDPALPISPAVLLGGFELRLRIAGAAGLPKGAESAACRVLLAGQEQSTGLAASADRSPQWLEDLLFVVPPPDSPTGETPAAEAAAGTAVEFEVRDDKGSCVGYLRQSLLQDLELTRGRAQRRLRERDEDRDGLPADCGALSFEWRLAKAAPEDFAPLRPREGLEARIALTVLGCIGLPNVDSFGGKSDPLIQVVSSSGKVRGETRPEKDTLNPTFNEKFEWVVEDPGEVVELRVLDWERIGQNRPMGHALFNLSQVRSRTGRLREQLLPSEGAPKRLGGMGKGDLGEIHAEWSVRQVRRSAAALLVEVREADGLANKAGLLGTSKAMVRVTLGEGAGAESRETQEARGEGHVEWREEVELPVTAPDLRGVLSFSAWNGERCLGVCECACDFAGDDATNEGRWLPLQPRSGNPDDAELLESRGGLGRLHVAWAVDTAQARAEREAARKERRGRLYSASLLLVRAVRAQGLPGRLLGLSPQCRLSFPPIAAAPGADGEAAAAAAGRRTAAKSGCSPVWGEQFSWPITQALVGQDVSLSVWHCGRLGEDCLGTGAVNVWKPDGQAATDAKGSAWVKLADDKGNAAGRLQVEWELADEQQPSRMVLQITVEGGEGIAVPPSATGGAARTPLYADLDFGHYRRRTQPVDCRLVGGTASPRWGDSWEFDPVPHAAEARIEVRAQGAEDVPVGGFTWNWTEAADISRGQGSFSLGKGRGTVALSWRGFQRDAPHAPKGRRAKFTVLRARHLAPVDSDMRVYAVLTLGPGREQTPQTSTADWQPAAEVEFEAAQGVDELRVELWEHNTVRKDTFLGVARLLCDATDEERRQGEEWLPLQPREGSDADLALVAEHGTLGEVRLRWELDMSDARPPQDAADDRDVLFTIVCASGLAAEPGGATHCVARIGPASAATPAAPGPSPEWDCDLPVFAGAALRCPATFEVWSGGADRAGGTFLGRAELHLGDRVALRAASCGEETLRLLPRAGFAEDLRLELRRGGLGELCVRWAVASDTAEGSPTTASPWLASPKSPAAETLSPPRGDAWLGELSVAAAGPLPQSWAEPPPVAGQCVAVCRGAVVLAGGVRRAEPSGRIMRYSPAAWSFDPAAERWQQLPDVCARVGASAVAHRGRVLLHGGFGPGGLDAGLSRVRGRVDTGSHSLWIGMGPDAGGEGEGGFFDDIVEIDPAAGRSRRLPAAGGDFRAGHCAVMCKGRMHVFGGWGIAVREELYRVRPDGKPTLRYSTVEFRRNDVATLEVARGRWHTEETTGAVVTPRSGHTGGLWDKQMFVFGGVGAGDPGPAPASPPAAPEEGSLLPAGGALVPAGSPSDSPRSGVLTDLTAAAPAAPARYFNELLCLDLATMSWTSLADAGGGAPCGRADHSCAVHAGSMFICGGRGAGGVVFGEHDLYHFSFQERRWYSIECSAASCDRPLSGARRGGRWGHSAVALPRARGSSLVLVRLLLIGGVAAQSAPGADSRGTEESEFAPLVPQAFTTHSTRLPAPATVAAAAQSTQALGSPPAAVSRIEATLPATVWPAAGASAWAAHGSGGVGDQERYRGIADGARPAKCTLVELADSSELMWYQRQVAAGTSSPPAQSGHLGGSRLLAHREAPPQRRKRRNHSQMDALADTLTRARTPSPGPRHVPDPSGHTYRLRVYRRAVQRPGVVADASAHFPTPPTVSETTRGRRAVLFPRTPQKATAATSPVAFSVARTTSAAARYGAHMAARVSARKARKQEKGRWKQDKKRQSGKTDKDPTLRLKSAALHATADRLHKGAGKVRPSTFVAEGIVRGQRVRVASDVAAGEGSAAGTVAKKGAAGVALGKGTRRGTVMVRFTGPGFPQGGVDVAVPEEQLRLCPAPERRRGPEGVAYTEAEFVQRYGVEEWREAGRQAARERAARDAEMSQQGSRQLRLTHGVTAAPGSPGGYRVLAEGGSHELPYEPLSALGSDSDSDSEWTDE